MNDQLPRRVKYFIMPKHIYSRRMRRYGEVVCSQCGNPIKVGDACISRKAHSRYFNSSFVYDQACGASLYYIEDALHIPKEFWVF